jgi:hypothetical protein
MIISNPPQKGSSVAVSVAVRSRRTHGTRSKASCIQAKECVRAVKSDLTNRPARFPRPAPLFDFGFWIADFGLKEKPSLHFNPSANPNSKI